MWSFGGLVVISGAWFLLATMQLKFKGSARWAFCDESLVGQLPDQVLQAARESSFEIIDGQDLLILTMPVKKHSRTCYARIRNSRVSELSYAYSF
jgi:hypothetical protein